MLKKRAHLPKPVPPPVIYAVLSLNVPGGSIGVLIAGKNLAWLGKSLDKSLFCFDKKLMIDKSSRKRY